MNLPRGRLVRSRVIDDPGEALEAALDRQLTGYARFEPQGSLLLDEERRGVVTFEAGVPVLAYDATTDRGGPDALADLATPGPYHVDLYEVSAESLAAAHDTSSLRVPPAMPAERLAGNAALAERTREAAPESRLSDEPTGSAIESFLADEEKIEAIRQQARAEARRRADEWGLADALATGGDDTAANGGNDRAEKSEYDSAEKSEYDSAEKGTGGNDSVASECERAADLTELPDSRTD